MQTFSRVFPASLSRSLLLPFQFLLPPASLSPTPAVCQPSICQPWPVSAPSKGSYFKMERFSSASSGAQACCLEFVSLIGGGGGGWVGGFFTTDKRYMNARKTPLIFILSIQSMIQISGSVVILKVLFVSPTSEGFTPCHCFHLLTSADTRGDFSSHTTSGFVRQPRRCSGEFARCRYLCTEGNLI